MGGDRDNKFEADKRNSLVEAVREIKIAAAERNDVVIDMKEADRARLEILAQELQPVFDEVPLDDERFDFAISSGLQPRLWIDATAHVIMGKDRRQYRFVRDTRLGRSILAESNQTEPVAEAVTRYIAERIHERELALAGGDITYRSGIAQRMPDDETDQAEAETAEDTNNDAATANGTAETKSVSPSETVKEETQTAGGTSDPRSSVMAEKDRNSRTKISPIGWVLIGLFIGGGALVLGYRFLMAGA